jgi:hypothetical protein
VSSTAIRRRYTASFKAKVVVEKVLRRRKNIDCATAIIKSLQCAETQGGCRCLSTESGYRSKARGTAHHGLAHRAYVKPEIQPADGVRLDAPIDFAIALDALAGSRYLC